MFKLLKYIKKYWYFALLAPLCMFGEVIMDMNLSKYMANLVDYGIQANNIDNILRYGFTMLGICIIGVICGIASGVFTNLAAFKFGNDLRKATYKKIMDLSYNQANDFNTGSLVTRVTNDITQIQNMVSQALRGLVRAFSFFILGIVFTLRISSNFGVILAVIMPLEIIILTIVIKVIFPLFSKIQKKLDQVNVVVHENVSGARVVKAFSKEEYEYNRFKNVNDDYTGINLYVGKISSFLMPLLMLLIYGSQVVIYNMGFTSIYDAFVNASGKPDIMVGQVSQTITYISMICMSIIMLGMTLNNFAKAFASAKRINEVLDCKLEIESGNLDLSTLTEHGTIEFRNVDFKYPSSSNPVLTNINIKINQGETIAIVGATGCGKSSFVNLIPRFYDVTNGELLIDGVNIKEFNLQDLRNVVGICLQKAELFKGTIKENVLWGNSHASDEEVIRACDIAQASEFVFSKEKGLDEEIEEKGTSLSGGQKQRLSIARAIIKKPEIIIFDDSTSALDLVTEAKLHNAMRKEMKDTTKIIVAQRIATAKNADKIIVLENTKVVAFDSHENLMKNCEIYQDIYYSQLKGDNKISEEMTDKAFGR